MMPIRQATAADRDAVLHLLAAQLAEHGIDTPAAGIRTAVDGILADPERGRLLVAVEDGRPVGVAALSFMWPIEHGGRSAWLEELYVEPAQRNRGVGRALLRAACETAAAAGATAVDLEVDAGHRRAARLYEAEGFRPLPRERWVRRLTPR
jgi:GNAT superfamily N-acetyltransferase